MGYEPRNIFHKLTQLNPYGGNRDEAAEDELDYVYNNARNNLGMNEAQAREYTEQRRKNYLPDTIVGQAANEWADAGRGVLRVSGDPTARKGLVESRRQGQQTRDSQIALLDMVRNSRGDATSALATSANDDLLRQAAQARARGADPALALTATARAGEDLGKRAVDSRNKEAFGQMATLQEGAHGIRGADLQRAAIEQQTLEGDLAFQQAKEDLYLKHIQQAQAQIASARGAEVDLAKIQAGGPADFDWGDALIPGLTQMASLGLMGLGSGGGNQQSSIPIGGGPEGAAYGNALRGVGLGDQNAVNDYLAKYGRWY